MATDACVGVQDMGAAGLTCSTSETGSRGGVGVEIDVALVPQRETGMTPYEIMLSESQERMLLIVKRGREAEVERDLREVGSSRGPDRRGDAGRSPSRQGAGSGRGRRAESRAHRRGAGVLAAGPRARRARRAAADSARRRSGPCPQPATCSGCCSRRRPSRASAGFTGSTTTWFVRTRSCSRDWARASCASRVRGARWPCRSTATAAFVGWIPGWARGWPWRRRRGMSRARADCPIGATNCLNFGNPERPEIMWQFAEAVAGIGEACRALDLPITGGNVSLYNETDGAAISAHTRHWRRRRHRRCEHRAGARVSRGWIVDRSVWREPRRARRQRVSEDRARAAPWAASRARSGT